MIISSITSEIQTIVQELPSLESNIFVDGSEALTADIDIQFDIEEVFPTSIPTQRVSLLVHVEDFGYIYPYEIASFDFYRDIEEGARLSLSIRGDKPKILTELNWRTAPPGLKKIQVWAGYQTSSGMVWKKLMTDGVSDSSNRTVSSSGAIMSIQVLDMKHRYKCHKVNYHVAPNSGKPVKEIIEELADLIGISSVSFPNGIEFKTDKEITINCEKAWDKMAEYAGYIGCKLNFDEYGNLKLYDAGEYTASSFNHVIADAQIISEDGFSIDFPGGDIATAVVIKGEKSENKECGIITLTTRKASYGPRTVTGPAWKQSTVDGSLTLTGYTDTVKDNDILSETIVISQIKCGTVIQTVTIEKGWKRRELWRYHLDSSGNIDDYSGGWIMDSGASQDDGAKCYADFFEKFVILSKVTLRNFFSNSGYYVLNETNGLTYMEPSIFGMPFNYTNLNEIPGSVLYRFIESTETWHMRQASIMDSSETPIERYVTGDGAGLVDLTETFYGDQNSFTPRYTGIAKFVDSFVYNNVLGFKFRESSITKEFAIPPGNAYIFAGNKYSSSPLESVAVNAPSLDPFYVGGEENAPVNLEPFYPENYASVIHGNYLASPENRNLTLYTNTTYTASGGLLISSSTSTDFLSAGNPSNTNVDESSGYLPASTFKENQSTDADTSRFFIKVVSDLLVETRGYCSVEVYVDLIDNEEWAEFYAKQLIREASALRLSVNVPMAAFILPGDKTRVRCKFASCNETALITKNTISKTSFEEPVLSNIEGVIYVV